MTYVYLIESKAVLYPLLFQQFPIKRCDHPPFQYGQYLGYGRVRIFVDLMRVRNKLWWVRASFVPLCRLAKAKMGGWRWKREFYERTTTVECSEDGTAVPSLVKMESDLCVPDRKQSSSVPSAFPAVSLTTSQSHLVPQIYHRIAQGASSLKTSSLEVHLWLGKSFLPGTCH